MILIQKYAKKFHHPTFAQTTAMHPEVRALIEHFQFEELPLEGTFFKQTYRSEQSLAEGRPAGTAMIGLYCREPLSLSRFHRLSRDEVWHFYKGDPFVLYLLHDNGYLEETVMGPDVLTGHKIQHTVPAGVWQAARLAEGSAYALFGCTLAPGFTSDCFEAGAISRLLERYPRHRDLILELGVEGEETGLPEGF